MELRQLKYFAAIARSGSFKKASIELRIAQPALSRQISMLEYELGVKLFNRLARGSALTQEGRLLLERAEEILRMTEDVRQELINCGAQVAGTVSVGLMPSLAEWVGPELFARTRRLLPEVQLKFSEGLSPRLRVRLTERDVDIAVLALDADPSYLALGVAFSEPISIIGTAGDPLFAETDPVELADIVDLPFVLSGMTKQGIRDVVERALTSQGLRLKKIVAETESSLMARRMVEMGLGYTISIRSTVGSSIETGQLAHRLINGLRFNRIIARSSEQAPSRAVLEVERLLTDILLSRYPRYRGT
ncbi:MAG: LysR family transcriptional regulator [Rhizobiaceae bacterium]|nr:LysR family transcriptional regulator [Rhizobiaceae bacterium]